MDAGTGAACASAVAAAAGGAAGGAAAGACSATGSSTTRVSSSSSAVVVRPAGLYALCRLRVKIGQPHDAHLLQLQHGRGQACRDAPQDAPGPVSCMVANYHACWMALCSAQKSA